MKLKGSKLLHRDEIEGLIKTRLNKVYFTPNLESIYQPLYRDEAAKEFRFRGIIIFLLYALLCSGIYQVIPAGHDAVLWISLYIWVGIIILSAWVLSFVPRLNPYFDAYTCLGSMCAVAITFIIITMIGNYHNDALLHAAMMYAVVIIYAFVGMRFYTVVVAGWCGGLIGYIITKAFDFQIDWTFLNRTYTYSSFLGMAIAYVIDRQHRENFLQNCIIELHQNEMQKQSEQLKKMTEHDPLTGLANRRQLSEALEQQWRYALRHQQPLSIMMIDIDFFKNYNDHLGHQAGDICLTQIAEVLSQITNRSGELAARYGGEEFLLLFPMLTEAEIEPLAADLLRRIQSLELPHPASHISKFVTISIGAATIIPSESDQIQKFILAAVQALYLAKGSGRNQYRLA